MNILLFLCMIGVGVYPSWSQYMDTDEDRTFVRSRCSEEGSLGGPRSERIARLRELFGFRSTTRHHYVDAYVIPGWDEHQSEVVSACDQRLRYISGFSQSGGLAVITRDQQVLWTSEQYLHQADVELPCEWEIAKGNRLETSTIVDWLVELMPEDSKVGADPTLIDAATWMMWEDKLRSVGVDLIPLKRNLVDEIWLDRPSCSRLPLYSLETEYTGQTWETKTDLLKKKLLKHKFDGMVVTSVDEVAWLLNLRGYDFTTNPLFKGYVLLDQNSISLYVAHDKVTAEVKRHLNTDRCFMESHCVRIYEYKELFQSIKEQRKKWKRVLVPSKQVFSGGCNFAVYEAVGPDRAVIHPSPIMRMKSRKNPIQREGMHRAQIRDAVAMCEVMAELTEGLEVEENWDEWKVATRLRSKRNLQAEYMIPSRETEVAFGSNSALFSYRPTNMTFSKIDNTSILLISTGGHYRDGTTDITRTYHLGKPSREMKDAYTRVLMGIIDVSKSVFPVGTTDSQLDIVAREPLLKAGKNYFHDSGHGIGAYSVRREDPLTIRKSQKNSHELSPGHFITIGPGYYEPYKYGIRLENILEVIQNQTEESLLKFRTVTLFPFDVSMIEARLMTAEQVMWINNYNAKVRQLIGPELKLQGKGNAFHWMMSQTGHVNERFVPSGSKPLTSRISLFPFLIILLLLNH